jgi:hypothetical protein
VKLLFPRAFCSSLPCIGRHPYSHQSALMVQDCLGNFWCSSCQVRALLIDWASEQGWPHFRVGLHEIGGTELLWVTPMVMGTDELVEAVARVVWAEGEEAVA